MSNAFKLKDEITNLLDDAKSIVTLSSSVAAAGNIPENATATSLDVAVKIIEQAETQLNELYELANK